MSRFSRFTRSVGNLVSKALPQGIDDKVGDAVRTGLNVAPYVAGAAYLAPSAIAAGKTALGLGGALVRGQSPDDLQRLPPVDAQLEDSRRGLIGRAGQLAGSLGNIFDVGGRIYETYQAYRNARRTEKLMSQAEFERQKANALNDARYKQLLEGFDRRESEVMQLYGDLRGQLGQSQDIARKDIQRNFAQQRGQTEQSMINRGLYNTTLVPQAQAQLRERESDSLARLAGQFTNQETALGLQEARAKEGLSLGRLSTIQSRTDEAPSLSQMIQLGGLSGQSLGSRAGVTGQYPNLISEAGNILRSVSRTSQPQQTTQRAINVPRV